MSLKQWRKVLQHTASLLESLPSEAERQEAIQAINDIIEALTRVRDTLTAMPTDAEAARAREALTKLAEILERNPMLRATSSRARPRGGKTERETTGRKRATDPQERTAEARKRLEDLASLPEDALRRELHSRSMYPTPLLRAMLAELGRRVPSDISRQDLIEQIVVAIVNRRTYEGLLERARRGG